MQSRLTTSHKMYLTLILSTVCIFAYQYQLSRARDITVSSNTSLQQQQQQPIDHVNVINQRELLKSADQFTEKEVTPPKSQPEQSVVITVVSITKPSTSSASPDVVSTEPLSSSSSNNVEPLLNDKLNLAFDLLNNEVAPSLDDDVGEKKQQQVVVDCSEFADNNGCRSNKQPPTLYIVTPTYRRPEQIPELTRLGYTLKHLPNVFWLVIEDAEQPTLLVTKFLTKLGIPFVHVVAPMPKRFRNAKPKPRGVSNRNRALQWIRTNAKEGVIYFADDDNTYDLDIFKEMRYIKKVAMWPVGLVTRLGVSTPVVKAGKIIGFYDGWIGGRKYPVDMAGFAVNVQFLLSRPKAQMPYKPGYEEDGFLKSLAPLALSEIELLASNCTEILTWHTQTKKNNPATAFDAKKYAGTNLVLLKETIV